MRKKSYKKMSKKKRQRPGKNIRNMKNSESIKVPGKYRNDMQAAIESNYWRSKGYNTKSRKVGDHYLVFRSRKKVD